MLKITVAQLNPTIGDFSGNLQKIKDLLQETTSGELIVLPEMYLSGYPPRDLLTKEWFIEATHQSIDQLLDISKSFSETGILVGTPFRDQDRLYNSAILIENGKIIFRQDKTLLPSYDVFDEDRYFNSSHQVKVIKYKDLKLGISICEDYWNISSEYFLDRYDRDPISDLVLSGADILINISASPYEVNKENTRRSLIKGHIKKHRIPFIVVNQVGGNDDILFDGKSLVYDCHGNLLKSAAAFKEDVISIEHTDLLSEKNKSLQIAIQDDIESIYQALIMGIKDYFSKLGFKKAVIGLSGGIDSALVAVLAVKALGSQNVLGITMPSMYSSEGSYRDSEQLADNLGIKIHQIPINNIYDSYQDQLEPFFKGEPANIAEENIQARIRGNLLMAFSNKFGYLVLSTGNKSELAMGYCTLYGDMSGGLAVISDVPKTVVYKLASFINRQEVIIPEQIVNKEPSAELRPNQKDQDSLPPYEVLDAILELYIEKHLSAEQIIDQGYEKELVGNIICTINLNEYKRKQLPVGLKITTTAFGSGRRIPIVAKY